MGTVVKVALGVIVGLMVLVVACVVVIVALIETSDETTRALVTGDAGDVTVEVAGDPGVEFSGAIGALGSTRSVEGVTPAEFTIEGEGSSGIFTVTMQKGGEAGNLVVTLHGCPSGETPSQSTDAAFGVVTVSC
jgi:hypothetical protein